MALAMALALALAPAKAPAMAMADWQVIDQTAQYVGRAVGMMAQVIDPAVVLLGGAMTFGGDNSNTGRGFLRMVRDTVKQTTLVQVGENVVIDFASLGNDAGVLGAAMVAKSASAVASQVRRYIVIP